MISRHVEQIVRGRQAVDGAGVRLTRVLSQGETRAFDPFLMLDSFDSADPADYLAGFPMHPHRGIETVTYLLEGRIEHEDSLGNRGEILAGEAQWMCSGSGILHQEMPKAAPRMLGFQLWLNLPAAEKMSPPTYLSITKGMIPVADAGGAKVHVLSGSFGGAQGVTPGHVPARILDVELAPGGTVTLMLPPEDTAFVFLLEGEGTVGDTAVPRKAAALLSGGEEVTVGSVRGARMAVFSAPPLREPIAWGGPIVMNTQRELDIAFEELRRGTFIR